VRGRFAALLAASAVSIAVVAGTAEAAGGPPAPKTFGGAKATLFATGLKNPTSFAWGDGTMFAGDSGNSNGLPNGGVYVVKNGTGTILPNGPVFVGGMAWHGGALYISGGFLVGGAPVWQIAKWSGWTGTDFTNRQTIYTAPKGFQGFNGIAFGPDGKLYVGADAGLLNQNDHGPSTISPFVYDILSMTASGKSVKVFASGMRQPWQMAFAGSKLFVSDLGQDSGAKKPPDFLLEVHKGDNYGFPKCNWTKATKTACKHAALPFAFLPPHFDPMGMAVVGKTLYVGSFMGMNGKGGALFKLPVAGGKPKPVVEDIPAATDALAVNGGYLYVGGSTQQGAGVIYRIKP
jgi:glucose/arabinose dehydrogenase